MSGRATLYSRPENCDLACHANSNDKIWLARHVRVAVVGVQTIFLDLRRNNYVALRTDSLYGIRPRVADWTMPELDLPFSTEKAEIDRTIGYLLERELVNTQCEMGARMSPPRVHKALDSLIDPDAMARAYTTPQDIFRACVACIEATRSFPRLPFLTIAEHMIERRRYEQKRAVTSVRNIRELVAAYWKIRPFFPFSVYTDILDSLSLLGFLARYGHFPTWVMGVRLMPFSTHSWVQEQDIVLNDTAEFVSQYTPIFVV